MQIDDFSEQGFWAKCKAYAKTIGYESMEKVLWLYYALDSEQCTLKQKSIIYGALAYLIAPLDAIPDLTPLLGYTDDMGLIAAAITAVALCIDDTVKSRASQRLQQWFGQSTH
ncbi:uncharacterized membrane protein YkvA (DUF1232 family) [Sinobacterium caligoides]|uniref:Uncharacterized membrane protein YkvA (DUF1232 family) n=1 Tax=Sinobacterium caligoides TaxID=933926 RepID=A0A3N2DPI8_9GAMM|nr:DUF1232 domain-containing protein [Sinobacterium caligoides]ROS01717.1 uncharacterized membrane protein YkvA (DUF1232 family) [Sinobacterium caligoides]